jgi:hypothetical protein
MIDETSTLEDVCFAVAGALAAGNMTAVLTGGSAAAVYAPNAYQSLDADFILDGDEPLGDIVSALERIDFHRYGRSRIFTHTRSKFTVDFPKGPLAVGGDYVHERNTLRRGDQRLAILTPVDCIRDRLAHFFFWDDFTALGAAVAVARAHANADDVERIRRWSERESTAFATKFDEFTRRLAT